MSRTKKENEVMVQHVDSTIQVQDEKVEMGAAPIGTITLSVSEKVAQLGQQQLSVTGVEALKKPAGVAPETRLGRKSGTVSLLVEARSASGRKMSLVLSDTHACWVQHQALGEARDQLADLWKHLSNGHAGKAKVTLEVLSVVAQPNGGATLEEMSW